MTTFPCRIIGGRKHLRTIAGNPGILSTNGIFYPSEVLRESVKLFEGVRVNDAHKAAHPDNLNSDFQQSPYQLGTLYGVVWSEVDQSLLAMFEPLTPGIRERFTEYYQARRRPDEWQGLSMVGDSWRKPGVDGYVLALRSVESVDLVTNPAGGGCFISPERMVRIVEADKRINYLAGKVTEAIVNSFQQNVMNAINKPKKAERQSDYFEGPIRLVK